MPKNKGAEFLIVKKEYSYYWCPSCNGAGSKSRQFRNQKFVENCSACNGTGTQRTSRQTEVPLMEALKELNLIK